MICLDLLQCYSQLSAQRVWVLCLKLLAVFSQGCQMLKRCLQEENLLGICNLKELILNFKKRSLVKSMQILLLSLGVLAGSSLLSGCATSQLFQFSAPSTLESNSSLSPHQKTKKQLKSSGDSSPSQVEQILPRQLQQDTFLLLVAL